LIKLRSKDDPNFKVDFHVDFSTIELIARDDIVAGDRNGKTLTRDVS